LSIIGTTTTDQWYTAGRRSAITHKWRWDIEKILSPSRFTNWKESRHERSLLLASNDDDHCLVLKNTERYYFWTPSNCNTPRRYICSVPSIDIGCMNNHDNGRSYEGIANVTKLGMTSFQNKHLDESVINRLSMSNTIEGHCEITNKICIFQGYSCLKWNDPQILSSGMLFSDQSTWHHNYCRNPDGDRTPWCMVSRHQFDLCDIPLCNQVADGILFIFNCK
jgi:hypothetical protein